MILPAHGCEVWRERALVLENEKSARSFRAKSLFSCAPSDGVKVFSGRDVRLDVRGISGPKSLCLGCFSVPGLQSYVAPIGAFFAPACPPLAAIDGH